MSEQWYNNKELFEMFNAMRIDYQQLSHEMKETRTIIKRYNGLYEKVENIKDKVDHIESEKEGKIKLQNAIISWGGWAFGLISLIILIYTTFKN